MAHAKSKHHDKMADSEKLGHLNKKDEKKDMKKKIPAKKK